MAPLCAFLAAVLAAAAAADPAATALEAKTNKLAAGLKRDLKIHTQEQKDEKGAMQEHVTTRSSTKLDASGQAGKHAKKTKPEHEVKLGEAKDAKPDAGTWKGDKPVQQPVNQFEKQPEKTESAKHEVKQVAARQSDLTDSSTRMTESRQAHEGTGTKICAVCFVGQLRNLAGSADSIHDNFLLPIARHDGGVSVDVFVAAEEGGPHTIADFNFHGNNFGADIKLIDKRWRKHQTANEIEEELYNRPLPTETLLFYIRSRRKGNWLGPIFKNPGNGMRVYRLEKDCIDMIKAEEKKEWKTYSWVIRTRPDFKWLVPHPPLSLMTTDKVWILDGEHFQGVNNRHVVGSRDNVLKLLDRQRPIMEGGPEVFEMAKVAPVLNDEYWMFLLGNNAGVEWSHIQYPGYLQKNPEWVKTGWRPPGGTYDDEEWEAIHSQKAWARMKNPCWKSRRKSQWRSILEISECSKESFIETRQSHLRR